MVYLDGTWKQNVTKGVQLYSATGLTADTQYIIGTRTVDTTGNVNSSWVNHTTRTAPLPDTTAPRSITGLANNTYLATTINWTWTDPSDADFSKVMVYLDGTWKQNVTKGVQLYSATGLTADTQHIIGTRTVDTTGNVNSSWVNHTTRTAPLPDTTAPRSITGLANNTYLATTINWTWTDPSDADFSKVMVYLDGTWKVNVTKGAQLYSATGLTADTQHTIDTRTVDTTGNVNASWVNHTARTAPLPDTTAPRSVTGLTNSTYLTTSINWVWTDPTDADFSKVMVYLDGTWKQNVTKGVQLYSATGLNPDTQYTIGTRTVDTTGNMNASWVNHTTITAPLPDTSTPRSITGLNNNTYLMTSINWVWTDPTDTDFSKVMVYLDGTFKTNVTKGVQLCSANGLTADTQYTLGTKTVDTNGNVNASWVNHTARTAPLPDTTAPRSVTGLTNNTYLMTTINWTWTDPTDADFSKVMVYLDGTWKTNVTKGVQIYSATGLTADTQHTLGTKTVDTTGNVNASWVNHTARTAPVAPEPPAAIFSGSPTNGKAPYTVTFTDSSTGTGSLTYSWIFGDGGSSTDRNPSHEYTTAGTYDVQLTVTGPGGSDTELKPDYITVQEDSDNDSILDQEEQGPGGTDPAYDGNNDGTPDCQQGDVASFHTMTGSYVTLVSLGGQSLTNVQAVDNPSPTDIPEYVETPFGFIDFTIAGLVPGSAVTVQLYLPSGTTVNTYYKYGKTPDNANLHWYEFLFDGTTGAEINENIITLHFVDGNRGDNDTIANGIITDPSGPGIDKRLPPTAAFSADPISGTAPLNVQFTDSSGGTAPLSYAWDFNSDGIVDSTEQNPVYLYPVAGTYMAQMTVTNDLGSSDYHVMITVLPQTDSPDKKPVAKFTQNKHTGLAPLTVQFTDISEKNPVSYFWEFGDGITSTDKNPSHLYQKAGIYKISLTVTNSAGSHTTTRVVNVLPK